MNLWTEWLLNQFSRKKKIRKIRDFRKRNETYRKPVKYAQNAHSPHRPQSDIDKQTMGMGEEHWSLAAAKEAALQGEGRGRRQHTGWLALRGNSAALQEGLDVGGGLG